MIQHYDDLVEQQSAPGQEEAAEKARRATGAENTSKNERCDTEAVRQSCGLNTSAGRVPMALKRPMWLRGQAAEAGRYAAQNC